MRSKLTRRCVSSLKIKPRAVESFPMCPLGSGTMMPSQKLLFKVLQISLNIVGQVDTKIYSGDSYWSQGSVP